MCGNACFDSCYEGVGTLACCVRLCMRVFLVRAVRRAWVRASVCVFLVYDVCMYECVCACLCVFLAWVACMHVCVPEGFSV